MSGFFYLSILFLFQLKNFKSSGTWTTFSLNSSCPASLLLKERYVLSFFLQIFPFTAFFSPIIWNLNFLRAFPHILTKNHILAQIRRKISKIEPRKIVCDFACKFSKFVQKYWVLFHELLQEKCRKEWTLSLNLYFQGITQFLD